MHKLRVTFRQVSGEPITGLWGGEILETPKSLFEYSNCHYYIELDQVDHEGRIISKNILLNNESEKYLKSFLDEWYCIV